MNCKETVVYFCPAHNTTARSSHKTDWQNRCFNQNQTITDLAIMNGIIVWGHHIYTHIGLELAYVITYHMGITKYVINIIFNQKGNK